MDFINEYESKKFWKFLTGFLHLLVNLEVDALRFML